MTHTNDEKLNKDDLLRMPVSNHASAYAWNVNYGRWERDFL